MGLTSKWQFGVQWRDVFWRWKVTLDNDYVSTKSITIFIIELGVWVIRASGNFGCNGGTFFDSGRLLWMMMMFQQNLLQFSSLSLVYGSYEQVAILGAMEGRFLTAVGYYFVTHTSMSQFHTG